MKKQIDPNLNNFDDSILDLELGSSEPTPEVKVNRVEPDSGKNIDVKKAEEAKPHENEVITQTVADLSQPLPKIDDNADAVDFSVKEKEYHQRHHSSHHHSSSGSHHSSSSSHHHSSSTHHSSSHHHSHHKKKKKMPPAAKAALIILSIVLVLVIAAVGTVLALQHKGKSDLTNVTTQTNYDEKITYKGHDYVYNKNIVSIAFLGVDKRQLSDNADQIGRAGQSDANIVLAVDTSTGKATAIAVPRDTMVDVDLYSANNIFLRTEKMQLCLSYAYGSNTESSAENVTTSISRILYDVPISKYFVLDLDGIAPINDAIGGVTVKSLYDFTDKGIKVGDQIHLTGSMTETYVRQRDMNTVNASLNRTARQVQYVKAFAAQLVPAVMNDFSVVSNLYKTASNYSTTNLTVNDVTYLASLMVSKNITDFDTVTLEGEMKESTKQDYADYVYAEFYPDEDKTMETVLNTFYTKIN